MNASAATAEGTYKTWAELETDTWRQIRESEDRCFQALTAGYIKKQQAAYDMATVARSLSFAVAPLEAQGNTVKVQGWLVLPVWEHESEAPPVLLAYGHRLIKELCQGPGRKFRLVRYQGKTSSKRGDCQRKPGARLVWLLRHIETQEYLWLHTVTPARTPTRPGSVDRVCKDCNEGPVEPYMVNDELWQSVGLPKYGALLHFRCLERRLGRQLVIGDFTNAPINQAVQQGYAMGLRARN